MKSPSRSQTYEHFSSDVYGDPHSIESIFMRFVVIIILGLGIGIIYELSKNNISAAILLGISVLPVLASFSLARRGQMEIAVAFLAVGLISLITIMATNGQGIHQISILAFPAILIIASLVIRMWALAFLTLYNIACVAWLIFGEINGLFVLSASTRSTPGEFFIAAIVLGSTAYMARLLAETLFQNNLRLQKELVERQRVERALSESLFRQTAILDNIPDLAWLKDEESRFIAVNEPFSQACGMSPGALAGKTDLDVWPEELAQAYRKDDFEVMRTGKRKSIEERLVNTAGEESWIQTIKTPIFDDSGQLIGTAGIARDITERRRADNRVRQLTRLYAILSQVNQTIVRTRSSTELFQAICQIAIDYGQISLAWIGLLDPASGAVSPIAQAGGNVDYVQNLKINLNDAATGNGPTGASIRTGQIVINDDTLSNPAMAPWRARAGGLNYLSSVAIPFSLKGETIGSLNLYSTEPSFFSTPEETRLLEEIGTDISFALDNLAIEDERKRVDQALRDSEERYRMLTELMSDYVFRLDIDPNGNATMEYLSENYEAITGRTLDQVRSTESWSSIIHPEDLGMVKNLLRSTIARRQSGELECRSFGADGKQRWIRVVARPMVDQVSGAVAKIVGTVKDVNERKRAEQEREKLIAELEAKNIELERFTYTVSHDLKSPLVTINGFLGFLEHDAATGNLERHKQDSQRIRGAVNKMHRLLNELLELSRIGRMMNVPENVPFAAIINDALEIVHGQLEEGKITVLSQPNLPTVHGDRQRLTEVLQNLLDNAAKYMGGQPDPRIEIGQRGEENGKPIFFVRDNGMGIAPEYHERIFGLFNKLDARSEGTGVGLALVERIIEYHGGRIWVESTAGKGSTFFFTLPKRKSQQ